jgi:hypothetical protein
MKRSKFRPCNSTYAITNASFSDQGTYIALLENFAGRTVSEKANFYITNFPSPAGVIRFSNRTPNVDVQLRHNWSPHPPLDSNYVAYLYTGHLPDRVYERVGEPMPLDNGYFDGGLREVRAQPGEKIYVRVVVSNSGGFTYGAQSEILELTAGTESAPAELIGLKTFQLQTWDYYLFDVYIQPPYRLTASLGQPAQLQIAARGEYPRTGGSFYVTNAIYKWLKNGVEIPNATNSTLTFENIQFTDAALYTAVATDGTRSRAFDTILEVTPSATFRITDTGRLQLKGPPGLEYNIEQSSDLKTWNFLRTANSNTEFDPGPPTQTRFYRATIPVPD